MSDWKVWGNSSTPIAENLNRDDAKKQVDDLSKGDPNSDFYAENSNGDTYPENV